MRVNFLAAALAASVGTALLGPLAQAGAPGASRHVVPLAVHRQGGYSCASPPKKSIVRKPLDGFLGIKWGASKADAITALSKKYTLNKSLSEADRLVFEDGTFAGERVDSVDLLFSSQGFVKGTVWFPNEADDNFLRHYHQLRDGYVKQYGKPDDDFEDYGDPYSKGDGHEAQAIRADKGTVASYWDFPADKGQENIVSLTVEDIISDIQIKAAYENSAMMDVYLQEKKKKGKG